MAARFASFMFLSVGVEFIGVADANGFLKAHPSSHQERISEEEVQTSLLAEIEGTFGAGSATSRLKQLEVALTPMFTALPKNEHGYLGHATVRYALHRLFVQRHGWFINGLHDRGEHRNSTSTAGILKEKVPAYVQDLFEKRLGDRGFGLHELGVLAATIEHLVHKEAIKRLGDAFRVHSTLPTAFISEREAETVLDTYMMAYILGEDLSNLTLYDAVQLTSEMPEVFGAWKETREFVRNIRRSTTDSDGSAEQKSQGVLDFALTARVAERVGEQFGQFQDKECKEIKSSLVAMEEAGTGRVRLSDFYKPALDGAWQFTESVSYLRQLGALDETDASKPRVIIANYISSPSNCIASSDYYSVCCMDECEGILGHLEQELASPEASPKQIAALITGLSSSSASAPLQLSFELLQRLGEIGDEHEGSVQLHGRLFAQWLHHAFPRECPFPHLAGTTNPVTPDEWLASMGQEATATEEEMSLHIDQHTESEEAVVKPLPWLSEEELLVTRPVKMRSPFAMLRPLVLALAFLSFAYSILKSSGVWLRVGKKAGHEKYLI